MYRIKLIDLKMICTSGQIFIYLTIFNYDHGHNVSSRLGQETDIGPWKMLKVHKYMSLHVSPNIYQHKTPLPSNPPHCLTNPIFMSSYFFLYVTLNFLSKICI